VPNTPGYDDYDDDYEILTAYVPRPVDFAGFARMYPNMWNDITPETLNRTYSNVVVAPAPIPQTCEQPPAYPEVGSHCPWCGWDITETNRGIQARGRYEHTHNCCERCAGEYVSCQVCGWTVTEGGENLGRGEYICDHCIAIQDAADPHECYSCGNMRGIARDIAGAETYICRSCFNQYTYTCSNCGLRFDYRNDMSHGYSDGVCCPTCRASGIGLYGGWHDADRISHLFGDAPWRLGIELEVEAPSFFYNDDKSRTCSDVLKAFGTEDANDLLIFERDGSLINGIEMITRPMSFDYFKENRDGFDRALRAFQKNRCRSHQPGTCGLHVHVGRKAFGNNETTRNQNITKLLLITELFWDDLVKLSRRSGSTMEQWSKKYDQKDVDELGAIAYNYADRYGRYQAINITNRNTVEFRFFRGTLNKDTFNASVHLCIAMTDICKALTADQIDACDSLRNLFELASNLGIVYDDCIMEFMASRGV